MTRGTVGERFTTAVGFAREAHHGDVRKKTSIPYLSHLLAVSSLAIEDAAEDLLLTEHLEDIAIAAVLHDVVEDTVDKESPVTVEDVRKHFGDVVAQIVEGCTDAQTYPKPEWRPRKEVYIEHLKVADQSVLCVALADKRHNARCIVNDATRLGPEFWAVQCWSWGTDLVLLRGHQGSPRAPSWCRGRGVASHRRTAMRPG